MQGFTQRPLGCVTAANWSLYIDAEGRAARNKYLFQNDEECQLPDGGGVRPIIISYAAFARTTQTHAGLKHSEHSLIQLNDAKHGPKRQTKILENQ